MKIRWTIFIFLAFIGAEVISQDQSYDVYAIQFAYGLKNENDISASTFETYKSALVPMRDNYLVLTFVANIFLIGILTTKYFKHRDRIHFATIEKVGLTISIITLLTLWFVKLFVPKGPWF